MEDCTSINFRGIAGLISPFRVYKSERLPEKFYYDIRHSDYSMDEPVTIELSVTVNYWATLILDKELQLPDEEYISITEDEKEQLIMSI